MNAVQFIAVQLFSLLCVLVFYVACVAVWSFSYLEFLWDVTEWAEAGRFAFAVASISIVLFINFE